MTDKGRRRRSRTRRLAAAAALCTIPAPPQAAAAAPVAAVKPSAPPRSGPGSLTGVWLNSTFSTQRTGPPSGDATIPPTIDGTPVPMRPAAQAIASRRIADAVAGHPFASTRARCLPPGMPTAMVPPAQLPLQILETAGQVTILFEEMTTFRIIRLDQPHPDDPDPTFMGNSIGHWDGDTLVVDTVAINPDTTIDAVIPHGERLHIVERIRRTGVGTLEDVYTIEDPEVFTRPWTRRSTFKAVAGEKVGEYICVNDRNTPDERGNTGLQAPAKAP